MILDALKSVTSEEIQTLEAPELRRRSAIIVNILRENIAVCKRILLEKFQGNYFSFIKTIFCFPQTFFIYLILKYIFTYLDTQCDAAGKLSQSIYVVESLLGKCHQEGELLFFTIRHDPQVKQKM